MNDQATARDESITKAYRHVASNWFMLQLTVRMPLEPGPFGDGEMG